MQLRKAIVTKYFNIQPTNPKILQRVGETLATNKTGAIPVTAYPTEQTSLTEKAAAQHQTRENLESQRTDAGDASGHHAARSRPWREQSRRSEAEHQEEPGGGPINGCDDGKGPEQRIWAVHAGPFRVRPPPLFSSLRLLPFSPTPHERTLSVAVHCKPRPHCISAPHGLPRSPRLLDCPQGTAPRSSSFPRACPVSFPEFFSNSSSSVAASPLASRVRGSELPAALADGGGERECVSIMSMFVVSNIVVAREASVIFFHPM
jgi:hypothetical protein